MVSYLAISRAHAYQYLEHREDNHPVVLKIYQEIPTLSTGVQAIAFFLWKWMDK